MGDLQTSENKESVERRYYVTSLAPEADRLTRRAAEIEKGKLLTPLTRLHLQQLRTVKPAYVDWLSEVEAVERQQASARQQQQAAFAMAMLGAVAAGVSAGVGDVHSMNASLSAMEAATAMMEKAEVQIGMLEEAGGALDGAIRATLAEFSVDLEGETLELRGRIDEKLAQLRAAVRRRLQPDLARR